MKPLPKALAVMALCLSTYTGTSFAQINKCKGPDGKTVYQDTPCATVGGQEMNIRRTAPPATPDPQTAPQEQSTNQPARPPVSERAARQDERGRQVTAVNAQLADLKYRDCVNRKQLLRARATACVAGACPTAASAYQEAEFQKLFGMGMPEDCETINPNRGR